MGQIEDLRLFVSVVDEGSIARAAGTLGIAKSAVSRRLAQLESRYDVRLIDRNPRAWEVTDVYKRQGMSRAVFHRKFKQATTMSPIQFVKSMRLNSAAMRIAEGTPVNEAALNAGYVSMSQFSREFKRMYGQAPSKWSQLQPLHQMSAG